MVSPSRQRLPQLPSRETLGDSTQLHFLPRLSCGQSSQSQPSVLRFPNLNIPFGKEHLLRLMHQRCGYEERQRSTGGGGVEEKHSTLVRPHAGLTWMEGACLPRCWQSQLSVDHLGRGFEDEEDLSFRPSGPRVPNLLRSSVSWPWAAAAPDKIRSTTNRNCETGNMKQGQVQTKEPVGLKSRIKSLTWAVEWKEDFCFHTFWIMAKMIHKPLVKPSKNISTLINSQLYFQQSICAF